MEAKEIKEKISPTPWKLSDVVTEPYTLKNDTDLVAAETAVNNTYGKNLNPEVYEDVVKALEWLVKCLLTTDITHREAEVMGLNNANDLLKKARI